MFEKLEMGLENLNNETVTTLQNAVTTSDQPKQPSPPPLKFGAIQIPLKADPDPGSSEINIFEFQNSTNTHDYLMLIHGGIRGDCNYYAEAVTLLNTLTSQSNVTVRIGSNGGSLYAGAIIANAVKTSKAKVTTIACGVVASAAALIWSYGQTRLVEDGSVLLFHMSSHCDWGNSEGIRITAENTVHYVKVVAVDPLVEQGILTIDEAEALIDKRQDVLIDSNTMRERLEKQHA